MITERIMEDLPVLEISNGVANVAISTERFARVVYYGLEGSENILGLHPAAEVSTELGIWKPIGGHRLWVAPESMPLSYAPDAPLRAERRGELSVSVAAGADFDAGAVAGAAPPSSIRPITWPTFIPPPAITSGVRSPQWSRPPFLFSFGLRPISPVTTSSTRSSIPRSFRSSRNAATA